MKTLSIPKETHSRLKIHCDKYGLKISATAARIIDQALTAPGGPPPIPLHSNPPGSAYFPAAPPDHREQQQAPSGTGRPDVGALDGAGDDH